MAIDTRNKRASAMAVLPILYYPPNPDGSLAVEADRAQVTWAYAGLDYSEPAVILSVVRKTFEIELYNKNGDLKEILTGKADVDWEYHRTGGCGQANVQTKHPCGGRFDMSLRAGDELRIKVKQELRYSGKLLRINRKVRIGKEVVEPVFYGYSTELRDPVVTQSYTSTELSALVKTILDDKIVGPTKITYNSADIEETDFVVESIALNHKVLDAFVLLGNLAGDVEWGVDRNKKFYFRKRDSVVRRAYLMGREIYDYNEVEDHESIINKVHVYGQGNTLITSITAEQSANIFGTREQNLFETAISSQADANRLGVVTLKNLAKKNRKISAKVRTADAFIESSHPLGATAISKDPIPAGKKYGRNFLYGENERYGRMKRDQIRSIRYRIVAGGMDVELVLIDDVPNLGDQQKQVEFQIKELQRR